MSQRQPGASVWQSSVIIRQEGIFHDVHPPGAPDRIESVDQCRRERQECQDAADSLAVDAWPQNLPIVLRHRWGKGKGWHPVLAVRRAPHGKHLYYMVQISPPGLPPAFVWLIADEGLVYKESDGGSTWAIGSKGTVWKGP